MPRIHCCEPLEIGAELALPERAVRHIQVLRMQPGQEVRLFPGADADSGREYRATITAMGRQSVQVRVSDCMDQSKERSLENRIALHVALAMPGNDRMDWLIEKATELGVVRISPLMSERSVLRLKGERAAKKREHWQGIAIAACEQCGRNRVPQVDEPCTLAQFLQHQTAAGQGGARFVLSLQPGSTRMDLDWLQGLVQGLGDVQQVLVLSGPEGGLAPAEESAALQAGFAPLHLGPRVLRAETAPLAVAAALGLLG